MIQIEFIFSLTRLAAQLVVDLMVTVNRSTVMASGIDIYSQLLISTIRISDISNSNG